jgi:hypothetical protein
MLLWLKNLSRAHFTEKLRFLQGESLRAQRFCLMNKSAILRTNFNPYHANMDFSKTFKSAFDIIMLKDAAMKKVAEDKNALQPALMIVGLVAIVTALGLWVFPSSYAGYVFYRPDITWLLGKAIWTFALSIASLYLVGYLAVVLFKSKLDMNSYVKVMGHGMFVGIAHIVPGLGILASLWSLVILGKVLHGLGKLEIIEIIVLVVINIIVIGAVGMSGLVY